MRILLVDDLPDARFVLRKRLEREGKYEIVGEAANGQEAVELAESQKPDLVIMDFRMPVMDGLEATRAIKEKHPDIDVVGFTAFEDPNMRESMVEAGALANVNKTDLQQLMKLLSDRADRADRSTPAVPPSLEG